MSARDIYASAMADGIDYHRIFANNVQALMDAEHPPLKQPALAKNAKMHQRTLNRILNLENSPTLENMVKIATGLGVSLWQLLVPNLDARNLPALAPVSEKERQLWATIRQAAQELGQYGKSQ
jgi:transcriptional regulator with XRE-family HTH domain